MENLLKRSLEEGVWGFSSGLAYAPANVASGSELTSLAKVAASVKGYYATHLRSESNEAEEALGEAIQISKEAKVPLHIAHFKVKEKQHWQKWPKMLDQVNEGLSSGLNITFDIYPYTVASVVLSTYLPDWVLDGGKIRMLDRLKDRGLSKRIAEEMKMRNHDFSDMRIAKSFNHPEFIDKGILDISRNYNLSPEEMIIEIIKATEGNVMCFYDVISEENLFAAIKHPQCMISTSGGIYSTRLKEEGNVHPRNFGTFPKFLKELVLEKKLLSLEEAIKKITYLPAKFLGLKNRGTIEKGNFADIVVFNPRTLSDRASFEDPYQYPLGIELVLVNGEATVISGQHTQDLPGKILRRS